MATEDQSRDRQGKPTLDREDDAHQFVDPDHVDFDPDEGLYSGTAVSGTSEIPGPHLDPETGELGDMDENDIEEN